MTDVGDGDKPNETRHHIANCPDRNHDLERGCDAPVSDFKRGYTAGYQARCREEIATYFEAITAGKKIYDNVIRGLINAPSYAERKEERLAVLREAHAAGLHVGREPRLFPSDCPRCAEDGLLSRPGGLSSYGDVPVPDCRAHGQPMMPGLRDSATGRTEWHCVCSPVAHNGHYGVRCAGVALPTPGRGGYAPGSPLPGEHVGCEHAQNPDYGAACATCGAPDAPIGKPCPYHEVPDYGVIRGNSAEEQRDAANAAYEADEHRSPAYGARTGWPENGCPRTGCERFHSGIPHNHHKNTEAHPTVRLALLDVQAEVDAYVTVNGVETLPYAETIDMIRRVAADRGIDLVGC
jgi:hypothetical protein